MAPAPLSGHIPRDTPTPAPRREVGPGRPELVAASAVRAALREEQARSKRLRRAIVLVTLLLVGLAALVVLPLGTLLVLSITGTPL